MAAGGRATGGCAVGGAAFGGVAFGVAAGGTADPGAAAPGTATPGGVGVAGRPPGGVAPGGVAAGGIAAPGAAGFATPGTAAPGIAAPGAAGRAVGGVAPGGVAAGGIAPPGIAAPGAGGTVDPGIAAPGAAAPGTAGFAAPGGATTGETPGCGAFPTAVVGDAGFAGDACGFALFPSGFGSGFSSRFSRIGGCRNCLGRGSGRWPSTSTESRNICATSRTAGAGVASATAFTPDTIIVLQNGQPTAISAAPVATASAARFSLMRVPKFSSMNMRAPPAPQQKPSLRFRGISTKSAPVAPNNSRGGSNTLLCRPKKHGSWYVIGFRSFGPRGIGVSNLSRTNRLSSCVWWKTSK